MGLWYIMSFNASCVSPELGESGLFRVGESCSLRAAGGIFLDVTYYRERFL